MKVQVVKAFTLTHQDGTQEIYGVGVQDVPEIVAEHWYTKLHLAVEELVQEAEQVSVRRKNAAPAPPQADQAPAAAGDAK